MKLTIFTPTYNRAYIINNLYKSLKKQTLKDFEWLVIDDGSKDNTKEYFSQILSSENEIKIRYYQKENGGKHTAANFGLEKAEGELFFVVDSDDVLTENAVERIFYYYDQIKDNPEFCGVCGLKGFFNGNVIGSKINYTILDSTIINYRFRLMINGDKADVFKTNLLKQHRFPEHKGEKWCPLSIVWNRFGSKLKVRYFNEVIYLAEYLEDGISLNRNKIRTNSPNNTMQYYNELSQYDIPLKQKIKACVNYWRFAPYSKKSFFLKAKNLGYLKTLVSFPIGTVFYLIDVNPVFKKYLDPKAKILKEQKA